MNADVYKALQFAIKAHDGQKDRGGLPYILHPLHVANQMYPLIHDIVVGLLHDVLEDTDASEREMRLIFGDTVVDDVLALTRGYIDENRILIVSDELNTGRDLQVSGYEKETYQNYIKRVAKNPTATRVKIEDLRHNLSRMENIPSSERKGLQNRYLKALVYLLDPEKYPEY